MSALLALAAADLLSLLAIDTRAHVRLVDAYAGDLVRASHHLAAARSVVAGTGAVPTPAGLHSAATALVVRLEATYGESVAGPVPEQRVLADDARHCGLPVIGHGED